MKDKDEKNRKDKKERNEGENSSASSPVAASPTADLGPPAAPQAQGSMVGWVALLVAIVALLVAVLRPGPGSGDTGKLIVLPPVAGSPVEIDTTAGDAVMGGTIAVYWQVIVSNTSRDDITLTSSAVQVLDSIDSRIPYQVVNHRFYSEDLSTPLDLPHIISAGHMVKFLVRITLPLLPEVYDLVRARLAAGEKIRLHDITSYLRSRNMDIFGNFFSGSGDSATVPGERFFSVSFETSRGNTLQDFASWTELNSIPGISNP
jgi:hypothetical protein